MVGARCVVLVQSITSMTYDGRVQPELASAFTLPRLFVIGDSISLHYDPHLQEAVSGKFSYARKRDESDGHGTSLDYPHGPFGENAGDSSMVLTYLRARPAAVATADVVLLNCGLHDLKVDKVAGSHQVPPESFRDNLARITALMVASGKRWAWCSTTPVDDATHARHGADLAFRRAEADVQRYNDLAHGIVAAAGVPVFDLHAVTVALASGRAMADLYADHVHFKPEVSTAQAARIAAWLAASFLE